MKLYGLDLGDGRTKIAMADRDGQPIVVPNEVGEVCTPSVVYFPDGGTPVVGSEAVNMSFLEPGRVARNWKRKMGTDEPVVESKTAKDVAAVIIDFAKHCIERRSGEIPTEMTITVPASYTEKQKQETIEAAESVGIKVTCLVSEPNAALLGNGIHLKGDQKAMVVDPGSSTTDVSVVDIRGNLVEVKQTNGDSANGAQDVNARLREHVLGLFKKEHGYVPDPSQSPVFYSDLHCRLEQIKVTLSASEEAVFVINDAGTVFHRKITRMEMEGLIQDFIERIASLVKQTLIDAQIGWEEITTLLAVGGGSRMPIVGRELERLSGKHLSQNVEPDYSAALGAIVAGRIELQRQGRQAFTEAGALPPINVFSREVIGHSLGVAVIDDAGALVQSVLLKKGVPYPSTQVRPYTLSEPNQTMANIIVMEGENNTPADQCGRLGEFRLENLPPYPDITERIEMTFNLDSSGLLTATARDLKSGISGDMKIEYKSGGNGRDVP